MTLSPGRLDPTRQQHPADDLGNGVEQLAAQWARIRGRLQQEVGDVVYRTWLRNMALAGVDGDEVTILLPSAFQRDWVRMHYADRLNALRQAEGAGIRRVEFQAGRAPAVSATVEPAAAVPEFVEAAPAAPEPTDRMAEMSAPLDQKFQFDNFVVGKPNEFA